MQAFDLEIRQQFCCVVAASQSTENSLPIAGTSTCREVGTSGKELPCCGNPPHPALVLPVPLHSPHWLLQGVSLWGLMQSSKPSEHFGGLRGCAGHGESGRGCSVRRSLPPRGTVVVKANKICSECYGCIPR